jgi:hypothetical protein
MNRADGSRRAAQPVRRAFDGLLLSAIPRQPRRPRGDDADLDAFAKSEGWHISPPEVSRAPLRPWQQAVFWGLRIYIVVMLVLMVVGFVHVAVRQ